MKKSKIKVLQFSIAKSMGGRTRYILDIWKWIDHDKFQFDFVTFAKEIQIEKELISQGCIVHHLPCYPQENEKVFIEAWNKILDFEYDIVHLNTSYWEGFLLEEYAYRKGVKKIIVHSHNTGIGKQLSDEEYERIVNKHYTLREVLDFDKITDFWACSEAAKDWLYGQRVNSKKIFLTYPAIDSKLFKFNNDKRDICRKKLGITDEFLIGTVGRLVYQKNHKFLLSAFSTAFKNRSDTKLIIVGNGGLNEELKNLASVLGIESQCLFVDRCEDIVPYYQAMDLFVLPSLYEGFPKVVVEAAAAGLKCICSDQITEEIEFCNMIQRMPLIEQMWSDILKKYRDMEIQGDREKAVESVKSAGFDIKIEIKRIQRRYLEE